MNQNIPLLTLSLLASAALTGNRFTTLAGAVCGAAGAAAGVARSDAAAGAYVPVVLLGTATLEAGGVIAAGDYLQSDSLGRGVTATTGPALALALEAAAAAGQMIEVLVIAAANVVADPAKLGQVLVSNDITEVSANGALPVSGVSLIAGGTGLAGLTLAAPKPGCQARIRVESLSSGTVVVTAAAGVTFDGTNNTATFNAANDELVLGYLSATRWRVIENTSVTFSSV